LYVRNDTSKTYIPQITLIIAEKSIEICGFLRYLREIIFIPGLMVY